MSSHKRAPDPLIWGMLLERAVSRPVRLAAWLALVGATGLLLKAEVVRPELPEGVRVARDVVYRDASGRRPRLDVYTPTGPTPAGGWPAVIAVHGGGWRGGSKADYGPTLLELVRAGIVVVAVDYHLGRPGVAGWPDNAEDVREAVRWVHAHAGELKVDGDRLALMGASAGAHLALVAGLDPTGSGPAVTTGSPSRRSSNSIVRVATVIDFYGPTDIPALAEESPAARASIPFLLGGSPAAPVASPEAASPVRLVNPGAPAVLIVHGSDDALVPIRQSNLLASALREAGARHRLLVVDGARHGFGLVAGGRDLTPDLLAFLRSSWKD